ncbi:uncharacterized protein LOC129317548 [Prosopis cineraria]|uniref:uncharacterized protein LOC129317548 n=1 Tax=Prosopis cineraria TaxID=364024 RepID=UPI00240F88A0|nr:uncharacterized protein LOC129317548 [Prosopis cineraria]
MQTPWAHHFFSDNHIDINHIINHRITNPILYYFPLLGSHRHSPHFPFSLQHRRRGCVRERRPLLLPRASPLPCSAFVQFDPCTCVCLGCCPFFLFLLRQSSHCRRQVQRLCFPCWCEVPLCSKEFRKSHDLFLPVFALQSIYPPPYRCIVAVLVSVTRFFILLPCSPLFVRRPLLPGHALRHSNLSFSSVLAKVRYRLFSSFDVVPCCTGAVEGVLTSFLYFFYALRVRIVPFSFLYLGRPVYVSGCREYEISEIFLPSSVVLHECKEVRI